MSEDWDVVSVALAKRWVGDCIGEVSARSYLGQCQTREGSMIGSGHNDDLIRLEERE